LAIFNPQVPDLPESNYLKWSGGPISQPAPDQSLEALFKGIGDVAGAVAKGGDAVIKKSIDDVVYAKADAERNKLTNELGVAYDTVTGQRHAAAGDTDVMTANAQAVPTELENVSENLTSMGSARANGKLSMTEYIMRRDQYLSDIRAQYPGYREYIDTKAEQATGIPVANALIKARMADINSFLGKAKSDSDKTISLLHRHPEIPGVADMVEFVRRGGSLHEAEKWLNGQLEIFHASKVRDLLRKDRKETNEEKATQSEKDFQSSASQIVVDRMSTNLTAAGMGDDPPEVRQKFLSGNIDPQAARQLAQDTALDMLEAEKQMRAAAKVIRPNGSSWYNDVGPDKAEKIIQENLAGYKSIIAFQEHKEHGPAYMLAHDIKNRGDVNTQKLLKHPTIGPTLLDLKSIFEQAGPTAVGSLAVQSMIDDLPTAIKAYRNEARAAADALRVDPKTGAIPALGVDISDAEKKGITNPKFYASMLKQVSDITDPSVSDKIKINRVKYAFSPQGQFALSQIQKEGIDPITGAPGKKGQYSAYQQLSTDEFISQVKRLNNLDPTLWPMYTNWVKNSFGNELLKPDILALKDIKLSPGLTMGWDTTNTKWTVTNEKGQDILGGRQTGRGLPPYERAIINRVNEGIKPIVRVAREENADPTFVSNYLAKHFIDLGYDPTIQNPSNFPQHLVKSIWDQKQNQKKYEEELRRKSRGE